MQIVDNTYQVADGYFISNFIGASDFAAENLIFPPLAIVASIGLMFGSGASALISYERGKGDEARGNRLLTMLMLVLLVLALPPLFGLQGIWMTNPVAEVLTAAVLLGMTLRAKDRPIFYRGGEA